MNLYAQKTYIDLSQGKDGRGAIYGESDVFETFTSDRGELFRSCVREYGRCTGKIYIDRVDGKTHAIGWVFVKRRKYDDCNKTFLAETWVTVHEKPPTKTITYYYAE